MWAGGKWFWSETSCAFATPIAELSVPPAAKEAPGGQGEASGVVALICQTSLVQGHGLPPTTHNLSW